MRGAPRPLAGRELGAGLHMPPGLSLPPPGTWGPQRLALPCFLRQLFDNYAPQVRGRPSLRPAAAAGLPDPSFQAFPQGWKELRGAGVGGL